MSKKRLESALGKGIDELFELASSEIDIENILMDMDAESDAVLKNGQLDTPDSHKLETKIEDLIDKGVASLKSGDYLVAAAHFLAATLINPNSIKALNNLGVCWCYMHRMDQAEQAFLKVLELDPQNPVARKNLSLISKN